MHEHGAAVMHHPPTSLPTAGAEIDPVCGMTVDPARAAGSVAHEGKTYYFCSTSCVRKFQTDPNRFLSGQALEPHHNVPEPVTPAAGDKVEYYCPMDPEVRSDKPGPCPRCGMALEPRVLTADEGPNPELIDM